MTKHLAPRISFPSHSHICLLVFDLSIWGHHPNYIKYLMQGWEKQKQSGELVFVVSSLFLKEHSDVVMLSATLEHSDVRFIAVTPEEEMTLGTRNSSFQRLLRGFREWNLLCDYADKFKATECFLPYFDTLQLPLFFGRSCPCPVSGIYFRPSFHYPSLGSYKPSYKERFQHWRERLLVNQVLHQSNFHRLFCLDEFAVDWMRQHYNTVKAVALPDPIELQERSPTTVESLKASLGVDPQRKVFLLFGSITERKGVYQLLDAIALLQPDSCQHFCLLLVGQSRLKQELEIRIQALCREKPVQIIQHYKFVPDETVPTYFQLADVVLAPYQRHVGMSGILLQAAASKKPVISSDYGLMGEVTRRYSLGLTVDSTDPQKLSQSLLQSLTTPNEQLGDPAQMQQFALQNTVDKFVSVIFQHLSRHNSVAPNTPTISESRR